MKRALPGLLALVLFPAAALAQVAADTKVDVPIGSWVETAGTFIGPLIAATVLWLIRKLPSQIADILKAMRVEQLLDKAIGYAINSVAGATKGKVLSVDVGSEVVANAAQYVVDNGPAWLIGWMGGAEGIRQKIIARLDLEPAAALK